MCSHFRLLWKARQNQYNSATTNLKCANCAQYDLNYGQAVWLEELVSRVQKNNDYSVRFFYNLDSNIPQLYNK